jgi:hypothetical protein
VIVRFSLLRRPSVTCENYRSGCVENWLLKPPEGQLQILPLPVKTCYLKPESPNLQRDPQLT